MEIWDLYDEYRNKLNKTFLRGNLLKRGEYHLSAHICLFNKKGEMLIQQRQSDRQAWANLWDITAGI